MKCEFLKFLNFSKLIINIFKVIIKKYGNIKPPIDNVSLKSSTPFSIN